MEQFNQYDSNDQSNYDSSNQNQPISHNDNGLSNQGKSFAVNNSANNNVNSSNANDRYQQNQPSQNQQYQQNQYPQYQYAQNQNWYGQYPNQYQNSQYYNNQEYVNNQYDQNTNNLAAQYQDNDTINSNAEGTYSDDYVKQSAPYNAMNADSSYSSDSTSVKANSSNFNLKSLLTKRNKIIVAVVCVAILLCVIVALCVPKKHDNGKQAATASSQSDSHKRSSTDAKSKPEEHQASPEAVDAGGPADYSTLPFDQIYDQNWYKTGSELVATPGYTTKHNPVGMDVNAPVNDHDGFYNFYNARYQIDSAAEKGQIGKVIRSEVSNSAADDENMLTYYRITRQKNPSVDPPKLTAAQQQYFDRLKSVVGDFKTHTHNALYAYRISYNVNTGVSFYNSYNYRHPGSVGYADMYQSNAPELNVPYVDENGNSIDLDKSAHHDSLLSVARWMLYDQGFYDVTVSPAGVWGTCRLDDRGYTEAVQIVLPSQDDPDKFDVFVGVLDDLYFNEVLTSDPSYTVADYSGTNDYALYASVLRQSNKSTGILPFRAILHNVDRPLRAKDNELTRVVQKFGINGNRIDKIVGTSFSMMVSSNMFVDNEIKGVGYGPFIHRGDVRMLPHYDQYVGSGSLPVYLNGITAHGEKNGDDVARYRAFMLKAAPTSRKWYSDPNKGIYYNKGMSNYDEFVKLDRAAFGN
ncbi:hypothetical protein [Gardnerella vaginalis]|uniref:hypothetical protein n=1 Tax=Gardnerella vaginalis TaxID=2702 RepID=UPI001FF4511F|nr:hypothetical protein [Gardnerella vaginalis]